MNSRQKSQLFKLMKETAAAVDAIVLDELSKITRDPLIPTEAILHLPRIRAALRGGQASPKLRATFIRLVFELLSTDDWRRMIPIGGAGELLAISSYALDDFLDHQGMRNGEPATWKVYGAADAIMAAQIQREVAERILFKLDLPAERVVRLAAAMNKIFFDGYLGQLVDSRMRAPSISHYIRRCEQIAGHFHGGLARMSAIFAGAAEDLVEKLARLGFWQGIALQIRNDLVDCVPSSILAEAGAHALDRPPFEDVRNGKWTMPLLYAYERADSSNRERIESWMRSGDFSDDTIRPLSKMLLDTGAYELTLQQITHFKNMALQLLLELPVSPARDMLSAHLETVENSRAYVQKLATHSA